MFRLRAWTWKLSCPSHRLFDPEKHGRGAARASCRVCQALCDVHDAAGRLQDAIRRVEIESDQAKQLTAAIADRRRKAREAA